MKTSLYFSYTWRALLRGGQRTLLAIFCVAVGVMAVVSLQLVGLMLQNSLTSNVRAMNGGDIAVSTPGAPLKPGDLTFFDQLKQAGTISNYTPVITTTAGLSNMTSSLQSFTIEAVDPNNYPLVSRPTFVTPGNGTIASLLENDQVVVTQQFVDRYQKQLGDTFNVYIKTSDNSGQTINVKIAGVVANTGAFTQSGNLVFISAQDYLAANSTRFSRYSTVDVTTADQAHSNAAVQAISTQFPLANIQTAADLLQSEKSTVNLINTFLEIAGLVALLIGGVGIVNTMQVLLSRRKTEIAMLKTVGYRRRDLTLLFGLEAGLLGLIGGIIGALASIGVSYIVRYLMENIGFNMNFALNVPILLYGVVIGLATALIFGLMPIIQAANIRPLHVIRDYETRSRGNRMLTVLLVLVLSVLFCLMAALILNRNIILGVAATYGTFVLLLVLVAVFSLIILGVSKLPVPERINFKQAGIIVVGIAISVGVYMEQPVFGIILLIISLLGVLIVLSPRNWKVSTKLALRNLNRRRTRTVTTMVALFIGVYCIGLVLGMGYVMKTQITNVLSKSSPYNMVVTTSGEETSALQTHLSSIADLSGSREDPYVASQPTAIDGQPIQQVLGSGLQGNIGILGGIEGYNLAQNAPTLKIAQGRNLNAGDANTNNVIVSELMTSGSWLGLNLKLGDTMTVTSPNGKTARTLTIVGIVSLKSSYETLGKVIAPDAVVNALDTGSKATTTVFYMRVPPSQVNQALDTLGRIAPNASVQNLTDSATAFLQQISSILDLVIAIALLSVLAAVIIIANAVALAMLERRRELGILKSIGYTSSTVFNEVLIENGIVGGLSAFVAAFMACNVLVQASEQFYKTALNLEPVMIVGLIIGPALLAMFTAALVCWRAVHVRPLEVLRYE